MDARRLVVATLLLGACSAQGQGLPELPVPRGTPPTPGVVGRPSAWPGGPRTPEMQPLEMTVVVARVGPEVILAGDVSSAVRELLASNVERIPVGQAEDVAALFLKQTIANSVDRKLLYLEMARKFQEEEQKKKVFEQIDEEFEKTELKKLLRRSGAAHRGELEAILAERGSTMEREKQNFREMALASELLRGVSKRDDEITHDDMLGYYRDHVTDYDRQAKAHWLQLFVRRGEKPAAECRNKIAWMGNQVQSGQSWAAIAKHHSDDASAVEGGDRGWTTKGSLRSKALDEALFSLPLGTMSPIIEDEMGWHIVRVVEREEAGRVPFEEAQEEIRDKIKEDRRKGRVKEFIEEVRSKTKVWTIFDDPAEAERLVTYLAAPVAEYLRQTARRPGGSALQSQVAP